MRLATIRTNDGTRAARLEGEELFPLEYRDVGAVLAAAADDGANYDAAGEAINIVDANFAPLVVAPSKIFCVGLNYRAHILETGREIPEYPTLFAKFAQSLIGAHDDVILPKVVERADFEVELGVVIGKPVHQATAEEARLAIGGYTVVNDVSMRDWQYRTLQWLQGKTFQNSTPVGPYLVTEDEVGDPTDLEVTLILDGEVMQNARTSDMVFSSSDIVAYISQFVTLEPGDLIATGTPGGVGEARDPKVSLKDGQIMQTIIENIGECRNPCAAER